MPAGEDDVEEQGDHGAEGDQLAVSKVGQSGRTEDEGKSDRSKRDDEAEHDAIGEELLCPLEEGATGGKPLTDGKGTPYVGFEVVVDARRVALVHELAVDDALLVDVARAALLGEVAIRFFCTATP